MSYLKALLHPFVSGKADGSDASLVRATAWNADHKFFLGGRTVTAAADTSVDTDDWCLVQYDRAGGACVVTLGTPDSTHFIPGWVSFHRVVGPGTVTLTAPAGRTINGAASLVMVTGQHCILHSDGTNYFAQVGGITTVGGVFGALTLGQGLQVNTGSGLISQDPSFIPGFVSGLHLTAVGGSNTFTISPGAAVSDDGTTLMRLSSTYTKVNNAAWAVGSGAGVGSLDTGAAAASTWYYVWLINRPDTGVTDVLISASATAPTLPASYTKKRLISFLGTNISATTIDQLTQHDDEWLYGSSILLLNAGTGDTTAHLVSVPMPGGFKAWPLLNITSANNPTTGEGRAYISSPDMSDEVPAAQNYNAGGFATAGTSLITSAAISHIRTNTSRQIRWRLKDAGTQLFIGIGGFRTPRRAL
jgi:hypothetical protein